MRRILPLLLVFLIILLGGLAIWRKGQLEPSTPVVVQQDVPVEPIKVAPAPWPQERSDIPVDSKAVYGALENGFRYIIVPNSEPPEKIQMNLHIDAGSLVEKDDQRGVAHFLEHMVFNGSKNFTPDELIPRMQRLGIAFGAHANAYTSFDETVYMLGLPDTSVETQSLCYTVMRDFADGALLLTEEIDKERGVIQSERTSRDSVNFRILEQQFKDMLPDSKISHRFPIGTEEIIATAQRDRFTEFYDTYYSPQLMTFIVAGDLDIENTRKNIEDTFGSLINKHPIPEEDFGTISAGGGFRAAVYTDKEVPSSSIALMKIKPAKTVADTKAERLSDIPLSVAHAMLNRRFSKLAKKEDSPILSGYADKSELFGMLEYSSITFEPNDGQWQDAVPLLEQELRRAMTHGFTQTEFKEVCAEILNSYEQAVKRAKTRESRSIASQLVRSVNLNRVFSTPETDLEIMRQGIEDLTEKACLRALKNYWDGRDITLVLTTQEAPEGSEETLISLYKRSQGEAVDPPSEKASSAWAYTNFGSPTPHTSLRIQDLEVTQLQFTNGVRVNLKPTDFEENSISVSARFGYGKLTMPKNKPGLNTLLEGTFSSGGLGRHSIDDLQTILAGKNVGARLSVTDDSFLLGGNTTPEDLQLQLQLMAAYLTDPGYRPEAMRQFKNSLPQLYKQLRYSSQGPVTELTAHLRRNDPRFVFPDQEILESYEFSDLAPWSKPARESHYLELSLVGDFNLDTAIEAISRTFGSLPKRENLRLPLDIERSLEFAETPNDITYTYESRLPKSTSILVWHTNGLTTNISQSRRLSLMADILNDRMRKKIREELGAAYSPSAGSSQSQGFPDDGFIQAFSPGTPDNTETVSDLIRQIAAEMAQAGITEDELERALEPRLSNLRESIRSNSYWLYSVLLRCQSEPSRLDWARNRNEDHESITVSDINSLARTYLKKENSILINILPTDVE